MLLFAPPAIDAVQAFPANEAYAVTGDWSTRSAGLGAASSIPLAKLQVGNTTYPFHAQIRARFTFEVDGSWACFSTDIGSDIRGNGETPPRAFESWRERVHACFQALYALRPFEMTPTERQRWNRLAAVFDLADYQVRTPSSFRELGYISRARPVPDQIEWVNGRREHFELNQVPDEVAGYKPGQWFEAVVRRSPENGRLIAIVHAQRTSSVPSRASDAEFKQNTRQGDVQETEWTWPIR